MKKEIQVLNYLKSKITLQIPDIEYYSEQYSLCGYKEIKGNKLTPDIYKNMRADEKDRLIQDIALFLREMIYDKIPDKSKEYLDNLYKRILNDEYYPVEQILGGQARNLDNMYNKGSNKIINI